MTQTYTWKKTSDGYPDLPKTWKEIWEDHEQYLEPGPREDSTLGFHSKQLFQSGCNNPECKPCQNYIHCTWERSWGQWDTPHARLRRICEPPVFDGSEEDLSQSTSGTEEQTFNLQAMHNVLPERWGLDGAWHGTDGFSSEDEDQVGICLQSRSGREVQRDSQRHADKVLSCLQEDPSRQSTPLLRPANTSKPLDYCTYWIREKQVRKGEMARFLRQEPEQMVDCVQGTKYGAT